MWMEMRLTLELRNDEDYVVKALKSPWFPHGKSSFTTWYKRNCTWLLWMVNQTAGSIKRKAGWTSFIRNANNTFPCSTSLNRYNFSHHARPHVVVLLRRRKNQISGQTESLDHGPVRARLSNPPSACFNQKHHANTSLGSNVKRIVNTKPLGWDMAARLQCKASIL